MITGNNNRFLRQWFEISRSKMRSSGTDYAGRNWVPYNKGGDFRKWYGNQESVADWRNEGRDFTRNRSVNASLYFRPYVSWSYFTSRTASARFFPEGFLWDVHGSGAFADRKHDENRILGLICSIVGIKLLETLNPTLSFQVENMLAMPLADLESREKKLDDVALSAIQISRLDWDAYETSWDFTTLPLLSPEHRGDTLEDSYATLRAHWQGMADEMQRLEEENNRIFIDAYGLQDELTPEVPIEEITLTCNPAYRYGVKGTEGGRKLFVTRAGTEHWSH